MIKQIKNKLTKKNKRGFTLIELIVVIAIVAVLAAVGIPAIAGQVTKSQKSTATANARLVAQQAQQMITESEVAGTPVAPTEATVAPKCGVKAADFVLTVSGTGTDTDPFIVDKVTFTVGGQTGDWIR